MHSFARWTHLSLAALLVGALGAAAPAQQGASRPHAGMLRYPDVSASQIVFSYADDLWLVAREGGLASPLASPPGPELQPRFSPDGKTIAFMGNYEGNTDLYTIPVSGGAAVRVTHHPAQERLCDWTAEGRLIFSSNALAPLARQQQLYTVAAAGGLPVKLPPPYGENGAIDPSGRWLAYTPYSRDSRTWKRYCGGMASDLWLFDLEESSARRITDWKGTDSLPMWHGGQLYYLSDRGEAHRLNLWTWDRESERHSQLTFFRAFDVKWPAMGPGPDGRGEIVFQNGTALYLLDLASNEIRTVEVSIPGDHRTVRERAIDASAYLGSSSISPTGKRAVVAARGDIWTLPAAKGAPRNLTRSDGVAERSPAWSPDGRQVAYFSDRSGEYEVWVRSSDGKGSERRLSSDGKTFRTSIGWSPDSKYLLLGDSSGALTLLEVASGETRLVDRNPQFGGLRASWSHDSAWLAYARPLGDQRIPAIWLYEVATGEKHQVTAGMFADSSPVFDRKGEYLFFASTRAFAPRYADLDTTFIYAGTQVLMAVPLRAQTESPWAPKSDEETWEDGEKKGEQEAEEKPAPAQAARDDGISGSWEGTARGEGLPGGSMAFTMEIEVAEDGSVSGSIALATGSATITAGSWDGKSGALKLTLEDPDGVVWEVEAKIADATLSGTARASSIGIELEIAAQRKQAAGKAQQEEAAAKKPAEPKAAAKKLVIDFEGFEGRALQLPVKAGNFGDLAVNHKGALLYVRRPARGADGTPAIHSFDLADEKKQEKLVAAGAGGFSISADGKKILIARGRALSIQDASAGAKAKAVVTSGMRMVVDPRAEWRQIFTDAWRFERDFFYDPGMHGVDWKALRAHYGAMIADCASRRDVDFVIGELIAELNVGHAYVRPPRDLERGERVAVGLLGCDFELHEGAYRIARILRGAPWDSDARGPLSQPGVAVQAGDYLLAVDGVALDPAVDPWAPFQGLAGRVVTLTVSAHPTLDEEAREILVKPLSSESKLRYRAWIEHNRARAAERSKGRVGYIYVPDTGVNGQSDLYRQLVGQLGRAALIIDERWNGGGQIPNRFIEMLNRPATNCWALRHGRDWVWPPDAQQGPKCMLINGLAGSGGDAFPAYFRKAGLGKLIGQRTWGGLVGITGGPAFVDGGTVTVPAFAYYELNGTWGIEGHGVDPDIEVVDDPAAMAAGADPQLDAAIDEMLLELREHSFEKPKRPAYPDRSGMGIREEDR